MEKRNEIHFREMYKTSGKNSAGYGFEFEVQPYSASLKTFEIFLEKRKEKNSA